jgi:Aconitase family (aconitate hydratase)
LPLVPKTLFDRIWESHVVREDPGEPALLYVDLHLIHEVTSPQAFDGLRLAGRRVRRPDLSLATMDHNVPTDEGPVRDPLARAQLDALRANCAEFGIPLYATGSGDVFFSNAVQIGLVPVALPASEVKRLMQSAAGGGELTVDLETETIADPVGRVVRFQMDPFVRHCLLNGLDAIARTLQHEDDIAAFEARFPSRLATNML